MHKLDPHSIRTLCGVCGWLPETLLVVSATLSVRVAELVMETARPALFIAESRVGTIQVQEFHNDFGSMAVCL
jgi:hypothetical protein